MATGWRIVKKVRPDEYSREALTIIADIFATYENSLRQQGQALLLDTIKTIHHCIDTGSIRIKMVCDQLGVSRSLLHALFIKNSLRSPGEFIRREQYRRAKNLLVGSRLTVSEISRAVGIASPIYFTAFIHRYSGKTPTALRG